MPSLGLSDAVAVESTVVSPYCHKCCSICLCADSSDINGQCSACKFHRKTFVHANSPFLILFHSLLRFCRKDPAKPLCRSTETTEIHTLHVSIFQWSRGYASVRLPCCTEVPPYSKNRAGKLSALLISGHVCPLWTSYFLRPKRSIKARYLSISTFFK